MVKLGRGAKRQIGGRWHDAVPLFPPGELPVFGPPPVNMRRPMPPPRGPPHSGGYGPPPMARPPPPPHIRPHHLPLHPPLPPYPRRPGPPHPSLRPFLQTPLMPPPRPFMRGGMGGSMHMGPGRGMGQIKRLGKPMKRIKNKKNKGNLNKNGNVKSIQNPGSGAVSKELIEGPWLTDGIKTEIEKMNALKKEAQEKKEQSSWNAFNEQKKKVESMANAAKMEYIGSQPDALVSDGTKNGTSDQK